MTTAETALALPNQWKAQFETYAKQQCNLLVPRELGPIPAFHSPVMAMVTVSPEETGGDCYKLPGGKYGLSKVALDRIAQAGAISWIPELCGRTDDGSDPDVVRYKMVGKLKDLNGQWRTVIGEKEVDLKAIEAELVGQGKATPAVQKEMVQFRKHRLARAQSGAMTRAIRSAFALRSSYTQQELSRPFVIPKMVFTPDYSDPDVKRFMLAEATGTIKELYGASAQPTGTMPPALPPAPDDDDQPALPPPTNGTAQHADPPTPPPPAEDPSLADEAAFQEAYNGAAAATDTITKAECIQAQVEILQRLMERKGYEGKAKGADLRAWEAKQRLAFYQHLIELTDATPAALPW